MKYNTLSDNNISFYGRLVSKEKHDKYKHILKIALIQDSYGNKRVNGIHNAYIFYVDISKIKKSDLKIGHWIKIKGSFEHMNENKAYGLYNIILINKIETKGGKKYATSNENSINKTNS